MRKTTKEIATAFLYGKRKTMGNTSTDGKTVWLHGNRIAWKDERGLLWCTLAGWPTTTTRGRVNGIMQLAYDSGFSSGVGCLGIIQKKGKQVLRTWKNDFHDEEQEIGSNDPINFGAIA